MVAIDESVSVIVPVYNEAEVIEEVLRDIYEAVVSKHPDCEFIVAEDGSTDGTKDILRRLGGELPIRLVMGEERKGYLRGVRDALLLATNDIVFFTDSDGQHDPRDFWKLLEAMDGHDLVCGMRLDRNDPLVRKLLSRAYNGMVGMYFGVRMYDTNCGFKMMRKEVVDTVVKDIRYIKYGFSTELIVRANAKGSRIATVPIRHIPRTSGEASQFPVSRLPRVIWTQMTGMRALKREIRSGR